LVTGESLSFVIYLHDYFSSITPGKVQFPVTVKVWRKAEVAEEPTVLRQVCDIDVMQPDAERFADRIAEIRSRIAQEQSAEQRLELYKSLASLSHADLVPIFLESLLDPTAQVFHLTARRRAVQLAETYNNRELLINQLAHHGGRYDAEFFRLWQERKVRLSDEQIARLCDSASLWTRLFCLEHYGQQYNRKGLIDSLEAELGDLAERVHKLKSTE
jgi:hypothetical protein